MLNRPSPFVLYPLFVLWVMNIFALAAFSAEPTVVGRTIAEWRAGLSSSSLLERQQSAHAISQFSDPPAEVLLSIVENDDATVRFWGTRGIKRSSVKKGGHATILSNALDKLVSDRSASVRIEAASALARFGSEKLALETLAIELKNPTDGARIMALTALEEMGDDAKPLESALKAASEDSSEYVKRISSRLLARWKK